MIKCSIISLPFLSKLSSRVSRRMQSALHWFHKNRPRLVFGRFILDSATQENITKQQLLSRIEELEKALAAAHIENVVYRKMLEDGNCTSHEVAITDRSM